jgi:hypothetical protein
MRVTFSWEPARLPPPPLPGQCVAEEQLCPDHSRATEMISFSTSEPPLGSGVSGVWMRDREAERERYMRERPTSISSTRGQYTFTCWMPPTLPWPRLVGQWTRSDHPPLSQTHIYIDTHIHTQCTHIYTKTFSRNPSLTESKNTSPEREWVSLLFTALAVDVREVWSLPKTSHHFDLGRHRGRGTACLSPAEMFTPTEVMQSAFKIRYTHIHRDTHSICTHTHTLWTHTPPQTQRLSLNDLVIWTAKTQ